MYDKLLDEALEKGLTVIEKYPFDSPRIRGLCCDDTIAISEQVETEAERTVILCEEIAHAAHSVGDILQDPRMERRVRERTFDRLISTEGLVRAHLSGCRTAWEFAEWFGVPEHFFCTAVENYRERYGVLTYTAVDGINYAVTLIPTLRIRRLRAKRGGRLTHAATPIEHNEEA